MISFTAYAEKKFDVLQRHGCIISRESVRDAVIRALGTDAEKEQTIFFAEKEDEQGRVVRVAYKKESGAVRIVTFYPVLRHG